MQTQNPFYKKRLSKEYVVKIKPFFLLNALVGLICYTHLFSQTIDTQQLEKEVAQWLNIPAISLHELKGGLTNTSFWATGGKEQCVVRLGKKDPEILGINRLCEAACQESASLIGLAPTILYSDPKNGTLVSSFIHGQTLTPQTVGDHAQLARIIKTLKKCHAIPFKKEFETSSIYDKIRAMILVSRAYENPFITHEEAQEAGQIIDHLEKYFHEKGKKYDGLCHHDLLAGNFIDDGNQTWLIDWEYGCWGNILFDLADLCIESNFDEKKTKEVLKMYFGQSWQENYLDFQLMCLIFNLRNAFWYDIRGKEIAAIGNVTMADYAHNHFRLFKQGVEQLLPSLKSREAQEETACKYSSKLD